MYLREPSSVSAFCEARSATPLENSSPWQAIFFLTPFVLHRLGSTQYGLWVLVGSALAYGSLLDFGILAAVIKYVATFQAQRSDDVRNLLSSVLMLYSKMGV